MRRSLPMAVVLAAALSVAACGDSNSPSGSATTTGATTTTSGSAAPSDPGVAWLDKVCGELLELSEADAAPPPDLSNPDPAQVLRAFDDFVAKQIDLVEEKIQSLRKIEDSPIDGGDEALTSLLDGLEALKNSYQTARDKFAQIDPGDTQAAQQAIVEVFTGLGQGSSKLQQAFDEADSNQEIKDAADKAPNCQKLGLTEASTSGSATLTATTTATTS